MPNYDNNLANNMLFGRKTIYTSVDEINEGNLISILNEAMSIHTENLLAEDYLYWYRRGIAPILNRKKDVRPEINNKVKEGSGVAEEIVSFKNGYFLTQPACYISRSGDSVASKVATLNEYLYLSGKHEADNEVVDWFHTVGKGAILVRSTDDEEVPFEVFSLDPRSAFVAYSLSPGNEPIMGVYIVVVGDELKIDVFTKTNIYRVSGTVTGRLVTPYPNYTATAVAIESVEPNTLGEIPIIEYQYNSVNMGAFESAISLLDSLDKVVSNRIDGIEQFIQSLLVFYNCQLDTDENGNEVTPAYIRQSGALFLKSFNENKADLKEISSQLDQTQTQVLVDDIYQRIMEMCAMPLVSKHGGTYDTTGAAVMANAGWYQADAAARSTSDLFKKSNRRFDNLICSILKTKGLLDIKPSEFELNFVRNETANIQSKAQAFQTLMSAGLHPELAAAKSGVSNDPVADIKMSEEYLKMIWGDPSKVDEEEEKSGEIPEALLDYVNPKDTEEFDEDEGRGEAEIIEEDNFNGEDEMGGAA